MFRKNPEQPTSFSIECRTISDDNDLYQEMPESHLPPNGYLFCPPRGHYFYLMNVIAIYLQSEWKLKASTIDRDQNTFLLGLS